MPWAEYAILDTTYNDLHVELFRVPFDIEKFVAITLASGMPHAQWSADEWNREEDIENERIHENQP